MFIIINMITVCCRFTHSFKIMHIPQPGIPEVVLLRPVQALLSGRGGKTEVASIRFTEGREPKVFEIWAFAEEGIREVQPYARVQISDNFFLGRIFTPTFSMYDKSEFLSWVADP